MKFLHMEPLKVLSTKKLLPALVKEAESKEIFITEQEFISVRPIMTKEKWEEIFGWIEKPMEYVVFTSARAVEAIDKYLHPYLNRAELNWKICCLSGRTRQAVEASHELADKIFCTAENASELAVKIIEQSIHEVVFFCGDQRRDELPQLLRDRNIGIHEVMVYQTTETPVALEAKFDGVLFFSPSAVRSFFSMNQLDQHTVCFAIGTTTADEIKSHARNRIVVSECTSQESMASTLFQFYRN